MSHKYIIQQQKEKSKYTYFSGNGLSGFDIRINEALVYDSHEEALCQASKLKQYMEHIEIVAVKVSITKIRAK